MTFLVSNKFILFIASLFFISIIAVSFPMIRDIAIYNIFLLVLVFVLFKLTIVELGQEKAQKSFVITLISLDILFALFSIIMFFLK